MPLVTCDECAGQVSSEATCCPHCGFPCRPLRREARKRNMGRAAVALAAVAVLVVGGYLASSAAEERRFQSTVLEAVSSATEHLNAIAQGEAAQVQPSQGRYAELEDAWQEIQRHEESVRSAAGTRRSAAAGPALRYLEASRDVTVAIVRRDRALETATSILQDMQQYFARLRQMSPRQRRIAGSTFESDFKAFEERLSGITKGNEQSDPFSDVTESIDALKEIATPIRGRYPSDTVVAEDVLTATAAMHKSHVESAIIQGTMLAYAEAMSLMATMQME